jgi:hypothetical protein
MDWSHHIGVLERAGVIFQPGLSDGEIAHIEARYGFRFPPDYRAFLTRALPVSSGFIDWRSAGDDALRARLERPRRRRPRPRRPRACARERTSFAPHAAGSFSGDVQRPCPLPENVRILRARDGLEPPRRNL